MFKLLAASALLVIFVIEAANLSCKSQVNPSLGGICAEEQTLVSGGQGCCEKADVYDADTYSCRSEPMPSIGGFCPDGFLLVAGEGCCERADAFAKKQ